MGLSNMYSCLQHQLLWDPNHFWTCKCPLHLVCFRSCFTLPCIFSLLLVTMLDFSCLMVSTGVTIAYLTTFSIMTNSSTSLLVSASPSHLSPPTPFSSISCTPWSVMSPFLLPPSPLQTNPHMSAWATWIKTIGQSSHLWQHASCQQKVQLSSAKTLPAKQEGYLPKLKINGTQNKP